jgi:transposase
MAKAYRPWNPTQPFLMPPSPLEWLPEGHLALFVLDLVGQLQLDAIEAELQRKDPRGERPYPPRMMVALLLYAYATGVFSSRKIARATYEDVAMRVLAAGEHPHFSRISQFRLAHRDALAGLFQQVLALCQKAGLVQLGHIAIDGAKIKANASKHKAMSHERMLATEARLAQEVEQLLQRAEATDTAEDAQHGVGRDAEDLPAELQRREDRLAKLRAARAALEQEAAEARAEALRAQADAHRATAADPDAPARQRTTAATLADQRDAQADAIAAEHVDEPSAPDDDLPHHEPPTTPDGTPTPEAQRNFTDPDSRIMKRDGAFLQAFNVQLAVDEPHQIIVAHAVGNQAPDAEYFEPMLQRVVQHCDAVPERTTADAGYCSEANVLAAEHYGTEPFIPVERQRRHATTVPAARPLSPARERMRKVLASPAGKTAYARRKCTVEPVFGQIVSARGFRQFLLRGLRKVRCEWALICLTHNVLKLFRATARSLNASALPSAAAA